MRRLRTRFLSAIVVLSLALSACTSTGSGASPGATGDAKPPITIGSKDFSESIILGRIYGLVLEDNGYDFEYKLGIGSTELLDSASTSYEIDVYAENTGPTIVKLMAKYQSNDVEADYEQVAAR